MTARRRIPDTEGRSAVASWLAAEGRIDRDTTATAVRWALEELAALAPGQSVEVRVPPFGATQILEGTTHRRGTRRGSYGGGGDPPRQAHACASPSAT